MKYIYDESNLSIIDRICQINNIDYDQLDVSEFKPDYNLEILNEFKEILLLNKDKKFLIVGDYDCDGICATTIIKKLLDDLKIRNNYYIPSRSKDSYGLNNRIVDNAINNDFEILLLVDNGVVAYESIDYAKSNGIDTLIIDHHEYEDRPNVLGLLHPGLFSKEYEDMCASGLCALLSNSFRYDEDAIVYGGLATLADMVSVLGYNRYLMKEMMKLLIDKRNIPISYLLSNNPITYDSLAFNVIPKINAVSRLEEDLNVNYVVKFLLKEGDIYTYLNKIEAINKKRKELSKQMYGFALRNINEEDNIIIIKSDLFIEGLCGIIANRLMNNYNKPVIVFSESDGLLKGSGRSPKSIDIYSYMKQFESLFSSFGGHNQALGLSLSIDKYDELNELIKNNPIVSEEIYKDVLVLNIEDINEELLNDIESLKPFGKDFIQPLFGIKDFEIKNKYLISKLYPKYVLSDTLEAISFKESDKDKEFKEMIGTLKKDDYHRDKISFIIEDLII